MKKELFDLTQTWKKVFGNWKYLLLAVFVAFIFYVIEAILTNLRYIFVLKNTIGFWRMLTKLHLFVENYPAFTPSLTLAVIILISILLGIFFSLIIYKTRALSSFSGKTGFFTSLSISLGIIGPGCSACGLGLLPALGLGSAALTFLPFGGLSILIISAGILLILIYKLSKDINKGIVCQVPQEKLKGGKKHE